MWYLVAVGALVSPLAMFACSDDDAGLEHDVGSSTGLSVVQERARTPTSCDIDDEDDDEDDDSDKRKRCVGTVVEVLATVPMTLTTVPSVVGREITIASGQVFGGPLGSSPATLIFTTPITFALRQGTLALAGNVSYGSGGSCTFVVTQGGTLTLAVATCNLIVNASNVVVGTGQVSGIITLVLNTISSNSLIAMVFLDARGELFVVNPVDMVSVDMDIQLGPTRGHVR
jgi:hypothetical protein